MARSRGGDRDAFGALVDRHHRRALRAAFARCGDPADAEDAAQEAFLRAWRELPQLADPARFGAWIASIARREAAMLSRRIRRRRRLADIDEDRQVDELSAGGSTPEQEAVEREDRDRIRGAIAALPAAHRDALTRFYLDDQPIEVVAEQLGVTELAIRQRLSRGRRQLRTSRLFRATVLATLASPVTADAAGGSACTAAGRAALLAAGLAAAAAGTVALVAMCSHARLDLESSRVASVQVPSAAGSPSRAASPQARRPEDRRTSLRASLDSLRARLAASGAAPIQSSAPAVAELDGDPESESASIDEVERLVADCQLLGDPSDPSSYGTLYFMLFVLREPVTGRAAQVAASSELSDEMNPDVVDCVQATLQLIPLDRGYLLHTVMVDLRGGGPVRITPTDYRAIVDEASRGSLPVQPGPAG